MPPDVDTAKDLLQLAAGPSILGVGALATYATSTYSDGQRISGKGWLALGAGVVLFGWLLLFLALSAPTVLASWTAGGSMEPVFVLLSAAWFVSAGLAMLALWKVPTALRYLVASYDPDKLPWILKIIPRWLK